MLLCDLQDYALRHLAYLVAAPTPQKMADVDERMNKLCTYLRPSSKEVEEMVKQAEKGRKRELNLPVDRIHSRLLKVSVSGGHFHPSARASVLRQKGRSRKRRRLCPSRLTATSHVTRLLGDARPFFLLASITF